MMCIRNMVIRKILILRVCGPYLAIRNLIMSSMIGITCIMKRVWRRSWRTTSFTVMVNWKNWYHLFIISARISIPFNVVLCWLYAFHLLALLIVGCSDRHCVVTAVKITKRIIDRLWSVAGRSSAQRNIVRRARMIAAPHQNRLSLQNLIVRAIGRRRIFNFWLNTWMSLRRCGVGTSTGHHIACRRSCDCHRCRCCRRAYGWRFWSFIFILSMLNNLVQKFL